MTLHHGEAVVGGGATGGEPAMATEGWSSWGKLDMLSMCEPAAVKQHLQIQATKSER